MIKLISVTVIDTISGGEIGCYNKKNQMIDFHVVTDEQNVLKMMNCVSEFHACIDPLIKHCGTMDVSKQLRCYHIKDKCFEDIFPENSKETVDCFEKCLNQLRKPCS